MINHWWLIGVVAVVLTGCGPEGYARIDPGGDYVYANPAWSPDSQRLAYTRCEIYDKEKGRKAPGCELFVMDVVTRQTQQLTDDTFNDSQLAWSPNGQQTGLSAGRGFRHA